MDSIYIMGYLVMSYTERLISTVSCLFSYFLLVSKLYELSLQILQNISNIPRNSDDIDILGLLVMTFMGNPIQLPA